MDTLPTVRFELRHGSARPTTHDMSDGAFLIGSVPGCDLRLPGTALPPVLCLIVRQPEGAVLRKLAPAQPILVNGRPVTVAPLVNGDRITLGAADLLVTMEQVQSPKAIIEPEPESDLEARKAELDARQRELEEQTRELETDRVLWYRRREEIDQECRRQSEAAVVFSRQLQERQRDLTAARDTFQERDQAIAAEREQLAQQRHDLEVRSQQADQQTRDLDSARQELVAIRQRLYDRYRQRRDRLAGLQEAVNSAARKVQEHKRQVDAEAQQHVARLQEIETRQADLDARAGALAQEHHALVNERQDYDRARADLEARERHVLEEHRLLDQGQAQYHADLVRMDRLSGQLDERQKQIEEREQQVESRALELQRDLQELEDQARQLDEAHIQRAAEAERIAQQAAELDKRDADITERAAAVEGQQAMFAALRGRLEKFREEVRRESQSLTEQRTRQEATEIELQERLQEVQRLRAEIDHERPLHEAQSKLFQERGAALEAAVARLREQQDQLAAQEVELQQRLAECESRTAEHAEQAALVEARTAQLTELQQRLDADRQALREREAALVKSEQSREALQEQLRRRSEELTAGQRALAEQVQQQEEASAGFQSRLAELQARRGELERTHEEANQRLADRLQEADVRQTELQAWDQRQQGATRKLQEMGRNVAAARKAMGTDRTQTVAERQASQQEAERVQAELAAARQELQQLQGQVPDLELRAADALERLSQSRDRLREHLAELHAFARQGREGLEGMRGQLQAQSEEVRQQELALHRARDEHRLAVATFRQQLIDWQGQVAEMKRVLAEGETRLERRQAEVEEQARAIGADAARLARQAEQLGAEQRHVAERKSEMERHLSEMREWYRRKLRELAASEKVGSGQWAVGSAEAAETSEQREVVRSDSPAPTERDILSLTDEVAPGDHQLGELMRSLGLVEADTLTSLLVEARRQRRSLRQMLLAGGYLTLYQLALIEAGNLDALVLGPTRVIDRLRATSREAVYRVFDPRRGREVVLRVLAEAEAQDAVHPDEFRQRFAAAAGVQHPHLAATLEILDIAGRPAVLQEWLVGLHSTDWPALAAVPGVWYRLLSQAALGLQTIHQAGLIHGHLGADAIVLTGEGVLKLCGLGEPAWLIESSSVDLATEDAAGDLAALGRIAAGWIALGQTSGKKAKALPKPLQTILDRLGSAKDYASAAALLESLDRAGADVPPNAEAWDRLLRHVREALSADTALRRTA